MKSKIIIASFLIVGAAIIISSTYLSPIIISRGNMTFDDNVSLEAVAIRASKKNRREQTSSPQSPVAVTNAIFSDNFDNTYTVKEVGSMSVSNNPNWW